MSAMLMHCQNEFKQILQTTNKLVFEAFDALEQEVQRLNPIDQINWYSIATQLLTSLAQNKHDTINPLDVFEARAKFVLYGKNPTSNAVGLALAVLVIGLGTLLLAAAIGFGVGVLLSLWATPLAFLSALIALETAPLIIAAVSPVIGLGVAAISGILLFKKPAVEHAFDGCVEAIKQNQLPKARLKSTELDEHSHDDSAQQSELRVSQSI